MLKFPIGWADKCTETASKARTAKMKIKPGLRMESPSRTKLYTICGLKLDGTEGTVKLTAKRDSHARSLVQLFANTVTYEETNDLSNAQFPSDENWELRIEHWPGTCLQIFSGIRYRKSLLPFLKTRTSSQFPQYIRTEAGVCLGSSER